MSDLISRQDAIEEIKTLTKKYFDHPVIMRNVRSAIEKLPSAQPKTGKWIDFSMSIKGVPTEACGECGGWSYGMGKNFCPNCGADMRGEQE